MSSSTRTRSSVDSLRDSVPSSWRASDMPLHLRHTSGTFRNARGQSLAFVSLFPPRAVALRGVVVFLHGITEHARRHFHLYEQLCEAGFGAAAYDLLGHGESESDRPGVRAYAERFDHFVDDTNAFISNVVKRRVLPEMLAPAWEEGQDEEAVASVPLILMGASFGTLVALQTLLTEQHEFAGLVLAAPAISVEWRPILRFQALFARPLAVIVPTLRVVQAVKTELLCRDPAFLDDYENDPLTVRENLTVRMGNLALRAGAALQREPRFADPKSVACRVPVLFLMGSADQVTSLAAAVEFFAKLRSRDKHFKIFDGMFHSLFDDPEKDDVFTFLLQWLEARFPVSSPEGSRM